MGTLTARLKSLRASPRAARTDPRKWGTRCESCPFAIRGEPNSPVVGVGPSHPEGIIIGESPGRDEAEKGEPFIGPTGEQLTDELIAHGLRRSKLFIVYAACCLPPLHKTEPMMKRAIEACRPALIAQLEPLLKGDDGDPPVLAMGKWAAHGLAVKKKLKGIMNTRGFVRRYTLDQAADAEKEIALKSEEARERSTRKADREKRKAARGPEADVPDDPDAGVRRRPQRSEKDSK